MKKRLLLIVLLSLVVVALSAYGGESADEESTNASTGQGLDDFVSVAGLTSAERGEIWAADLNCIGCHSTDGSPITSGGPTWLNIYGSEELLDDGTYVTVDDAYITKSILDPGFQQVDGYLKGLMPKNFEGLIEHKEKQVLENEDLEVDVMADLIAYIQTISE